jgi:hypothetical protein
MKRIIIWGGAWWNLALPIAFMMFKEKRGLEDEFGQGKAAWAAWLNHK